jgi:hypothetical protein
VKDKMLTSPGLLHEASCVESNLTAKSFIA